MGCSFLKVSKPGQVGKPPDPNPARFSIVRTQGMGLFTVALINYPDATPYNGNKVLVFNLIENQVRNMKVIDPHFTGVSPEPLARFRGDAQGWELACILVANLLDM